MSYMESTFLRYKLVTVITGKCFDLNRIRIKLFFIINDLKISKLIFDPENPCFLVAIKK